MKLLPFLIATVFTLLSLSSGAQTVNLNVKDLPLRDVFSVIKKQTGIFFFYDDEVLKDSKPVTLNLNDVSIETALNEVFIGQQLRWVFEDKTVTIFKDPNNHLNPSGEAVARSQAGHVNGTITDNEGSPIYGVSVMLKGTGMGTISDERGKFSIKASRDNTLLFSSVNYSSKEVKVTKNEMTIVLQLELKPMEATIVGGNMNAIKRRGDATSVTVLNARMLEKIPANTLDQIFRGWVQGVNSFNIGPEPESRPSLSIRGAAGENPLSAIAIYVDGFEYAGGSAYLSTLDKTNIDRIEIVRGPGAATLYGTGSNGGIIQIFTKKPKEGETSVNVSSAAGFYKSKWVDSDAFQQMHTLETNTGFKNAGLILGGSYRTIDAYLPEGGEKNKGFYSNLRFKVGKLNGNITARYNKRNYHSTRSALYDTAINPRKDIIIEPVPGLKVPAYLFFNVQPRRSINRDRITDTYIAGVNLSHKTARTWTNNFDAGITSNNMSEVPRNDGPIPLQFNYTTWKNKVLTLRYFNVLRLLDESFATAVTSGVEYKRYSNSRSIAWATPNGPQPPNNPDNENYGAFVQFNSSYKNVYLTTALRLEKNNLFKTTLNPRLGLTTNIQASSLIFKPRISWGKGISAPSYLQRFGQPANNVYVILPNSELKAQSQHGFDYGLEFYDEMGKFKFEAVYYDNTLENMVALDDIGAFPGDTLGRYMHKNAGEVLNRGWEFMAELRHTRFTFRSTLSIMNSTLGDTTGIHQFALYKDKAPGTRLTGLPRVTGGLSIDYNFQKLFGSVDKGSISLNGTMIAGLEDFDGRSYTLEVAYGRVNYERGRTAFDTESKPVVHIGLYSEYNITSSLRFFALGSNILNNNAPVASVEDITHGATWLFGLKYQFSKEN